MKDLFSIGYLSKLFEVSIKTLRYYDKIGLFKPEYIDEATNYRYYTANQITLFYIIKELKYQGFTLSDIQKYLSEEKLEDMSSLYKKRRDEVDKEIEQLMMVRDRLEQKIDRLEVTHKMLNECRDVVDLGVELKNIPARKVVFARKRSPFNFMGVALRTIELFNLFHVNNLHMIDPYFVIFHDEYKSLNIFFADYEMCAGIDLHSLKEYQQSNNIKEVSFVRDIPDLTCACVISKGSYEESMAVYNKLLKWIEDNGYVIDGPMYKEYIANFALVKNVGNIVYELQIPIKKK